MTREEEVAEANRVKQKVLQDWAKSQEERRLALEVAEAERLKEAEGGSDTGPAPQ